MRRTTVHIRCGPSRRTEQAPKPPLWTFVIYGTAARHGGPEVYCELHPLCATKATTGTRGPEASDCSRPARSVSQGGSLLSRAHDRELFCHLCPDWYNISDVIAKSSDPSLDDRSWAEVMLRDKEQSLFSMRRGKSIKDRAVLVSQGWKPYCPTCGNLLPDTTYPVQVIGIIGNFNSSKSHYLAGLAYELTTMQPLRPLGIEVSYIPAAGVSLDGQINLIYAKREVLPHTERGSAYGPYIYRLTRRSGGLEGSSVLAFFDIAGEDATSHIESAKLARYIFHAAGIVLLLDPDGLPREGSTLEAIDPNTPSPQPV